MEAIVFLYNIILTVAFALNFAVYIGIYVKTKERTHLFIGLMFFLFTMDNLLLYMMEFLPGFPAFYSEYLMGKPYISNILGLLIVLSYRLVLASDNRQKPGDIEKAIWVCLFAVYMVTTSLYPHELAMTSMLILRSLLSVSVVVLSFEERRILGETGASKADEAIRFDISSKFILLALALQITEAGERFFDYFADISFWNDRYISIEILSIVFSAAGLWHAVNLIKGILNREAEGLPKLQEPVLTVEISSYLDAFCQEFGMTPREREVMELLVMGKSNVEIGEQMVISQGTVKTHVHNIYKKLEINGRIQLMNLLSEYNRERASKME